MKRSSIALLVSACVLPLTGCIVIPIGDLLKPSPLAEQVLVEGDGFFTKEKIAIIDIEGMISGDDPGGWFASRENSVAEVKSRLDRCRRDPEVRAVVLRISSPGGEVTACDILHREVMRFKTETGKPVVASIGAQGTSGAYYIATAADRIYAHPTAVVGSIGVLLQHFDLSGLLEKLGVVASPVKSAQKKDINSLFRPMQAEEREVLQELVDDLYQRFVDVVDAGRPDLDRARVLELADGRIVSGTEAAELKLVDGAVYLGEALEVAREEAGVASPTYIHYTRVARSGANIYTQGSPAPSATDGLHVSWRGLRSEGPRLLYLWRPGS